MRTRFAAHRRLGRASRGVLIVMALLFLALAGLTRTLAAWAKERATPVALRTTAGGDATAGLDSFALGLLLGGLRGPLVMALWTDLSASETGRQVDDLDTKIELIRLLQPQFDSVHVLLIRKKAYDRSTELANAAGRYAAVLDAVEYADSVNRDRPNNIDIETTLGQIYANRIGGGEEKEYLSRRVHEETQARQPVVRIEFDAGREQQLREAALKAGVTREALVLRPAEKAGRLVTLLQEKDAIATLDRFAGDDVTSTTLQPADEASAGRPQRLPPMLTPEGELLPELTAATREPPAGATAGDNTYLDGSQFQFLDELGPFPEGLSPFALAYEHFRKARVLQEYAGQRHVDAGEMSVNVNPGRALRDWAVEAFEEGRQFEAEGYGFVPLARTKEGNEQQQMERMTSNVSLDTPPESEALLRRALTRYARSRDVAGRADAWLTEHLNRFPAQANIFGSNVDRMRLIDAMLEADELYLALALGDVPDDARASTAQQAIDAYRRANDLARDYVVRYFGGDVLPREFNIERVDLLPITVREQAYRDLQRLRDRDPLFEQARGLNEFDGYRLRAADRVNQLQPLTN